MFLCVFICGFLLYFIHKILCTQPNRPLIYSLHRTTTQTEDGKPVIKVGRWFTSFYFFFSFHLIHKWTLKRLHTRHPDHTRRADHTRLLNQVSVSSFISWGWAYPCIKTKPTMHARVCWSKFIHRAIATDHIGLRLNIKPDQNSSPIYEVENWLLIRISRNEMRY